jgi:hypothetical protein
VNCNVVDFVVCVVLYFIIVTFPGFWKDEFMRNVSLDVD